MKIFGVFEADWIWTLPALTAWLWASGGSGMRPLRRIGVPIALTLYAYGYGMNFIAFLLYFASTFGVIAFSGYGDDYVKTLKAFYWPYIFLLGAAYSGCQFMLVVTYGHLPLFGWLVLTNSLLFWGSLFASKKLGLPWKCAEMVCGFSVGLTGALIIGS